MEQNLKELHAYADHTIFLSESTENLQNMLNILHSNNYLGVLFNYDGRYSKNLKKQISQAKRALFALLGKSRKPQLPLDLQCHLFDACIVPILLYICEVWGFTNVIEI